jgi:hypothetical protein
MELKEKYPDAYEDDRGTIWVSRQDAEAADWTYKHGDAFMENILGWHWEDAEANYLSCRARDKRRAFWKAHPRLRYILWFIRCWYGALSLFSRTVWRDWYGRISWSTAWQLASDLWLR